jgi:hypothetical protein
MKKMNQIIIGIWFFLIISPMALNVNAQTASEPSFSENATLVNSWLNADLIAIGDLSNPSAIGADQTTRDNLPFRVIIGGYRLDSTEDLGTVDVGVDETTGNDIVGFYRRYNIEFTIGIRTLTTSSITIGEVTESDDISETYARLYAHLIWTDPYSLVASSTATYKKLIIPSDWRQRAEAEYSDTLIIRLSMNPQFDLRQNFDTASGTYDYVGLWAGFSDVRTQSDILSSLRVGLIKDNVDVITQLGGEASDERDVSDEVTRPTTITSTIGSAQTILANTGYKFTEDIDEDESSNKVGAIVDKVHNTPSDSFDMFRLDQSQLNFQFDTSKININNTRIYFPYNFRLRPETNILQVSHHFNEASVWVNSGAFGGVDRKVVNPDVRITIPVGYAIHNPYSIQKVIGSVDIVSQFEFTPNVEDRPPIDDFDEFRTNTNFNAVPTGDQGELNYEERFGLDLFGVFGNLLNTIITIALIVGVGVIVFLVIRRNRNQAQQRASQNPN